MPTTDPAPLWCANDAPHEPHSQRNAWDNVDYCTGRPEPKPSDSMMEPGRRFPGRNGLWRIPRQLHARGYLVEQDPEDHGVHRIRDVLGRLAGMYVIRDGRIRYAELNGRVFPFWPTGSYQSQVDRFAECIQEADCA